MKKLSLLLMAVAFLCPKVANAQDGKGSINFVPYVGVNYSDFSGKTNAFFNGTSGKVNFMGGARFEFKIAKESAIIANLNYRRLGATADKRIRCQYGPVYVGHSGVWQTIKSISVVEGTADDAYVKQIRQLVMDEGGEIIDFKKITIDCVSFGLQFKQNVMDVLSVRAGIECSVDVSRKYHYHDTFVFGRLKDPSNDPYEYNETINHDAYNWITKEKDDYIDMDDFFSDDLNLAIPLGLTYDYKNFSVNATYHLPLTKCVNEEGYYLRHQALDFTIGYRLPLRKR